MRSLSCTLLLSLLVATPTLAQTPPSGPGGGRRFAPPPDHWMTIDSLTQTLSLTADQRAKVTPAYTALNAILKDVAARRRALRERMQQDGSAGSFVPGQEPTPEQRARMDSVRAEMEGFQAEADEWLAAIRGNLTPAQQTKFDALPKPQLVRRAAPRQ